MSKEELYSKLYTYLLSEGKRIPYEDRIILFTVLNQSFRKTILPIEKLDMDFKLSPHVLAEGVLNSKLVILFVQYFI